LRYLKIFGLLFALHLLAWAATHFYLQKNQREVLLVVDTSFAMKKHFASVSDWIEDYENSARYSDIRIGTDKAALGRLSALSSRDVIFRTAFGKLTLDNLKRHYSDSRADEKLLLTNSDLQPDGWRVVNF